MYQIDKLVNLQIGVQGENIATDIEVDMTTWAEKYPEALFYVLFKPYNEDYAFPVVSDYDSETCVLTWHITFSATAIVGVGYTEIRAVESDAGLVKKTRIIPTVVEHSVSGLGTDDPPEPYEDWVNTVLAAKDTAVDSKEAAEAAQEAAETARDAAQAAAGDFQGLTATATGLAAGSDPTVSVTHSEGGLYNMAFGIPKGETGDPAPSDQVIPAVSSYLSQVITNPDSPPLDRTLASANAAAPADMVGDLKSAIDKMLMPVEFDYSGVATQHWGISSAGKWSSSVSQLSYTQNLDSSIKRVKVVGHTNGSIIAFIKTFNPVSSANVDFSTKYTTRISVASGETKEFAVTGGDMNYMFALLQDQSGNDHTPAVYYSYTETDTTLTQTYVPADAKTVGDLISAFGYVRMLTSADDMDNISNGVYRIVKEDYPDNAPMSSNSPSASGIVVQFGQINRVVLTQIIASYPSTYFYRNKKADGWSDWTKYPADNNLDAPLLNNKEALDVQTLSAGEMYELPISGGTKFVRYKDNDGDIIEQDVGEYGTDYIKCPKYIIITFAPTESGSEARILMYFYTLEDDTFTPRWDIINLTTTTGIKNYLSSTNSRSRVVEVPEGTYLKICTAVKGDVKVYGWSGTHFGPDVCGNGLTITGDEYVLQGSAYAGESGITIPGSVKLAIAKNHVIENLWGTTRAGDHVLIASTPRQSVLLPDGYAYFIAKLTKATIGSDEEVFTRSKTIMFGDLNDSISFLTSYHSERPYGRANKVIERARKLFDIKWTCMTNARSISNSDHNFKYNKEYEGAPYMSRWTKACYLGWHISAHTFVNAANDSRSVFYKESGRNGGPGYGLVCSSFACLVSGWPYPVVNYGFPRDPQCEEINITKPQIGMIMTKNRSHCLIPETFGYGDDFSQYSIYEEVSPMLRRGINHDFINTTGFSEYRRYDYVNDYIYCVTHQQAIDGFNGVYDLEETTIVNGTARPHRGDRSVYTSDDTIHINIKDSSATTCFYQRCTYNSKTDTFTLVDSPMSAEVMTDNSHYSILDKNNLTEGFYAVWTDMDSTKEYFEYHTAPECSYTMTENDITFNVPGDEFWYAVWWETDIPSRETEIIPYLENGDYSEYRKVYNPNNADGYMFFKGTLGAYVVPLIHT